MSKYFTPFRSALLALLIVACAGRLLADTDAVVTGGNAGGGVVAGAVGFSFVPTTNLTLTRVGFLDSQNFHDAIVSFWAQTNSVIASYDLGPSSNTQTIIYFTNVNLTLAAGQPYSITMQDGALTNSNTVSFLAYLPGAGGQITVAPEISNYQAVVVSSAGAFSPIATNAFLFGVDFSYQTTNAAPPVPPTLTIQLTGPETAVVSWPSPSTGFILETNVILSTSNWFEYVGTINTNSLSNSVTISPALGNLFFRLRYVPF